MEIRDILARITQTGASDIFVIAGLPLTFKLQGKMHTYDEYKLTPQMTAEFITNIYLLAEGRDMDRFYQTGDDDFSFAIAGVARYRANTFKQRGSLSAVIRVITYTVPQPSDIGIPDNIIELVNRQKGMVLVTGPAGSGKSTTLACMIDAINSRREAHIITLEDPLEYLHMHKMSIVSQREVNTDTESYLTALRASLRQSPDVILLGEMRDYETMNVAMTAAETGHLILSTLHTIGAANTIDRIIDAFPPNQQHQIAIQLSMVLQAVVSQQLIPTEDGRVVPAFEIMTITPAIRNMIRESKIHQIDGMIYSSSAGSNMLAMDTSLLHLYQNGIISEKSAMTYATNPDMLQKKLRG
ncbi:MAG: PilT/PilU family type 4a pilus ATPase [bacterium]|nr:PilT/PilU family type 4a pilus ATPase [bacterium]